jgi:tetratricopeptide repeat protein 21B
LVTVTTGTLLERAPALLARAEHHTPRASQSCGLHFCRALYQRAKGDLPGALKSLSLARRDPAHVRDAVAAMVGIYLMPDATELWEEADEAAGDAVGRIGSAERLLSDYPDVNSPRYAWLRGQVLLAARDKRSVDTAVEIFNDLVRADRDSVPGLLGLALASGLTKQQAKAKNFLKRVVKVPFDAQWAEEMERAQIMLGDVYYEAGKLDQALAAIKAALGYNASSSKAWAGRGRIEEKDCAYADAAESYERAWTLDAERSTEIGFKLAFNFLKAKRWVDAINVCHKVLKIDPQYPKIKKEILDKARANIRQ